MTTITPEQRKQLRAQIKQHGLERVADAIEAHAQAAIFVAPGAPADDAPIGQSRMGGAPDLPPGMAWPRTDDGYLTFLAQFNLADVPLLPEHPLPTRGLLSFFVEYLNDMSDLVHQIHYFDAEPSAFQRALLPADRVASFKVFPPHVAVTQPCVSLPYDPDYLENDPRYGGITLEEDENYIKVCDAMQPDRGSLFGHGTEMGRDFRVDAQLRREGQEIFGTTLKHPDEANKWRLLFEIHSERKLDMKWFDLGYLQFLIHEDDLARRDFSRTYASISSP